MPENGDSILPEQFREAFESATNAGVAAGNAFEDGLSTLSDGLRSHVAVVKSEASATANFLQRWYHSAQSGLSQADDLLISTMKDGVRYVSEHETAATAAGVAAVALTLPPTRRLLWRATLGRFTTAEAAQQAAERRVLALQETIDSQAGEINKLSERLDAARIEYERGLSKLKGTANELRHLNSRVHTTERKAKMLVMDLRDLRSNQSLQLRSDAAVKASAAGKQRSALDRMVARLEKDGLC